MCSSDLGGDIVRANGLRVLVRKLRRQRILEAQVSRDEAQVAREETSASAPREATSANAELRSQESPLGR